MKETPGDCDYRQKNLTEEAAATKKKGTDTYTQK